MKVVAVCTMQAWDSASATMLYPGGGPLEGGKYEIDRDGQLASMKTPRKTYVFDFDRAAPLADKPRDYTCDTCGEKCKSLNELGTHVHKNHPVGSSSPISGPDDGDEEPFSDRTCKVEGCGKVLKSAYGLRLHMEKSHPETTNVVNAETEAVPA